MTHKRVIPRDFFNESKLLKCLGQFELCVHDQRCGGLDIETELTDISEGFIIKQNPNDGSLFCDNYTASLHGHTMHLFIPYNSRKTYPLIATYGGEDYWMFSETGEWLPNFGVKDYEDL